MQALQPDTTLQGGKYKILSVLGQGGFGITYLAENTMMDTKVAIKEFFMKDFCNRDGSTSHVATGTAGSREIVTRFREKFLKEARNISRLNHPNIISVNDIFEENGTAYYAMYYAQNGSLADLVKREGWLPKTKAKKYILQVASALCYIHKQNMVHLDIKPANIMLNDRDEAMLIDFGLSKQYDVATGNQTSTTPVGISEGYAPLEQYMQGGVSDFSPETDIYALGATYYKLLTGKTPPNASYVSNEGLPVDELKAKRVAKAVIDLIGKAMESRKRDRIKDVQLFIDELNSGQSKKERNLEPESEETLLFTDTKTNRKKPNFSYPLTIHVNKRIYTDCQLWTVVNIQLYENKTIINMTAQSLNEYTTAWSGSGIIRIDKGKTLKQKSTSLPTKMDEDFVINPWQTIKVKETYPAIPSDAKGFSLVNDAISITGVIIEEGNAFVPEENSVEYIDTTEREIEKILNNRNKKSLWNKLFG